MPKNYTSLISERREKLKECSSPHDIANIKAYYLGKTGIITNEFAKLNIRYHLYHQEEINNNELHFKENTSIELVDATKEFVSNIEASESYNNKNQFYDKQISFNKFINERFEEIYEDEVLKHNYFKKDLRKKNEFLKIIKRFKSCEGTFSLTSLKNFNL